MESQIDLTDDKRTAADRWTPNLTRDGWTPVSTYFLNNYSRLGIKPGAAMFILHLMSFKWNRSAPYPGFKVIARRMGLTPEGVRLLARNLQKNGFLYRQVQVGTTNKFHLDGLFAALEKLKAQDDIERSEREKEQKLREHFGFNQDLTTTKLTPP